MTPEQFSKAYADALPAVTRAQLRAQEARLLASQRARSLHRTEPWRWRAAATALMLAALIALSLDLASVVPRPLDGVASGSRELSAQMAGRAAVAGALLTAGDAPTRSEIAFSEGTRVLLQPHSTLRLAQLGPERVDLELVQGKLEARVHKHTGLRWTIAAGPFAVHVVGTEFTLAYDAERAWLRVEVTEGRVRVTGPTGITPEVVLDPGGRFESAESPAPAPPPVAATPSASQAAPAPPLPLATLEPQRTDRLRTADDAAPRKATFRTRVAWQSLARAGDYVSALRVARRSGVDEQLQALSAQDLLLFADSARLAGEPELAEHAYLALRRSFAGSAEGRVAAFSLGRLAAEVTHDEPRALRWFEAFLAESPVGELAAGARARLMQLYASSGELRLAAAVARDYLAHDPAGPHAASAAALVARAAAASEPAP